MDFSPLTPEEETTSLAAAGCGSFGELLARQIPAGACMAGEYELPEGLSESRLLAEIGELAALNRVVPAGRDFLGGGIYRHFIPSVVPALAFRSEFLTSYTPYQPEASQGTLQAIFEFQTMISELTALPIANASLYDGASAAAEAARVAAAYTKNNRVVVSGAVHPEYVQTIKSHLEPMGIEVVVAEGGGGRTDSQAAAAALRGAAALLFQHPNFFGCLEEAGELSELARAHHALLIAVVDPISLALLAPPGDYGAAIAVGEGQSLGVDPSFGGPGFGFFACTEELLRSVPGRICGRTNDVEGRTGYTLTLQAREQHIKRERATSNICTNHQLTALAATIYLAAVGPGGLREVAEGAFRRSHYFVERLESNSGWRRSHPWPFFKEVSVTLPGVGRGDIEAVLHRLAGAGIFAGIPLGRFFPDRGSDLLISLTEQHTKEDIDLLVDELSRGTGGQR